MKTIVKNLLFVAVLAGSAGCSCDDEEVAGRELPIRDIAIVGTVQGDPDVGDAPGARTEGHSFDSGSLQHDLFSACFRELFEQFDLDGDDETWLCAQTDLVERLEVRQHERPRPSPPQPETVPP